jgi:LacI family transcriptional regulator
LQDLFGAGARGAAGPATIHDVALLAGVSIATASKALNGSGRMKDETRERVRRAAADLAFRPNPLARALLSRRSFAIGLLTNDTYGRFTLPVMAGVTEGLLDRGVSAFLCAIDDDPVLAQSHLDALLDRRVDGIIATGRRVDRPLPVALDGLPVPVVYVLTEGPPDAVTLLPDEAQGAREAVEHLIASGRRRIAHASGPDSFHVVRERSAAWQAAIAEAGLPAIDPVHGPWSEATGHTAVARLWDAGSAGLPTPDALFCGNDQIARGAIDALRERGLEVPRDVVVVGFDNWELVARETRPPLTSVDLNLKELGRAAGRALLALVEGRPEPPGARRLPCTLRVRESSGGEPGERA